MSSTSEKLTAALQVIEAATRLAITIPALVGSIKETLGSDDQAQIDAALTELQAQNDKIVPAAIAALRARGAA